MLCVDEKVHVEEGEQPDLTESANGDHQLEQPSVRRVNVRADQKAAAAGQSSPSCTTCACSVCGGDPVPAREQLSNVQQHLAADRCLPTAVSRAQRYSGAGERRSAREIAREGLQCWTRTCNNV